MALTINNQLDFMNREVAGKADDERMVMKASAPATVDHNIVSGARSAGIAFHGEEQTHENNRIRQELLDACKHQFGVLRFADLPESVREAFKVNTFGKNDMKLVGEGMSETVTSGRPLTARRIRVIIGAVTDEINRLNAPGRQEEEEFAQFRKPLVALARLTASTDNAGRVAEKAFAWGEGDEIAHYGFDDIRTKTVGMMTDDPAQKRVSIINTYNRYIGLEGSTVGIFRCVGAMWKINDGTQKNTATGPDHDVAERWAAYLHGKDVDIFAKIKTALAECAQGKKTGWAGEMARLGVHGALVELVRKNLSGATVRQLSTKLTPDFLDKLADVFFDLAQLDINRASVVQEDNWKRSVYAAIESHFGLKEANVADKAELETVIDVLNDISAMAFFRQTSKLGLDFFRQEGIPVVFEWTDCQGDRLPEDGGLTVHDTWWKDPDEPLGEHYGATITYSEMRHVQGKLNAKPGQGIVAKVEGTDNFYKTGRQLRLDPEDYAELDADELARRIAAGEPMLEIEAEEIVPAAVDTLLRLQGTESFLEKKEDGTFALKDFGVKYLKKALARTRADYEALTSPRAKAAYLAHYTALVQANLIRSILKSVGGMYPFLMKEFGI